MSCSINLMTPFARRREVFHLRLRQWRSIIVSLLLLLVIVTVAHYCIVRQLYLEQQLLETAVEPIDDLKEANVRLADKIAAIREKDQFLIELSEREPTVTLLGIVGSTVAQVGNGVFLETIEIASPQDTSNTSGKSPKVLGLAGKADKSSAADQVANELQTSFPFMKVDVTSNGETQINSLLIHDFSLQCTFQD